jgi:hypothetical protein
MAVTHSATVRDALANEIASLVDTGVGANATLEFQTSGDIEVATCNFSATAFGAASSGVITANAISSDISATGGTVAKAVIKDKDGDIILSGSVTTSGGGGDVIMSSLSVGAGDTVSVSSLTYTAPN